MTELKPSTAARFGVGSDPQADGRQSERARDIARGCCRLLAQLGLVAVPEVTLPNRRRADLTTLSPKGAIGIVEIKSSIADFQADQKWPAYLDCCETFHFAVGPDFPIEILPECNGVIIADRYGAEIVRPAPMRKISAPTRKALTLLIARSASARLMQIADPDLRLDPALTIGGRG